MKSGFAKIPVQNSFCAECSEKIKRELLKIRDITNVYLFSTDSLVIFNFVKANELSMALNTLTELGYPPKGDSINAKKYTHPFCQCMKSFQNDTARSKKELRQPFNRAS